METKTRERPILFAAPMVRAVLNTKPGVWPAEPIDPSKPWKWQTRRVMKPQPKPVPADVASGYVPGQFWWPCREIESMLTCLREPYDGEDDPEVCIWSPYGPPGTRLWVRETWCEYPKGRYIYRADYGQYTPISDGIGGPWKPSIHMPRRASRLTLEVARIRVERLEDITEADALAEGFASREAFLAYVYDTVKRAPRGSNPWVWAIDFRRCADAEA